jgi:hypothetical protein
MSDSIRDLLPPATTADSDGLAGTLASPTAASLLTAIPEFLVIAWARAGRVRSEHIRGEWVVDVGDCERLGREEGRL